MTQVANNRNFTVVELAQGVFVRTSIPSENHSALRAGFAGFTANPRWGAAKFLAWRTGRQWRTSLSRNELVIRSTDSMLVPVESSPEPAPEEPGSSQFKPSRFKAWASQSWGSMSSHFA